jgi:chromosome partitioning protein
MQRQRFFCCPNRWNRVFSTKGRLKMAKIIAFANQKGGVGKTTTAINIGASLAAIKRRVLLVDLDPQGNAGTGLGFVRAAHPQSVYGVIMGTETAAANILSTAIPNLHILPSSPQLSGAEVELLDMENREYRLRDAISSVANHYDYILLDCPPALGYITLNAMTTADSLIIPLQCEFFALEGIQSLLSAVNEIKRKWNPELDVLGIVLTMYDRRYGLTRAVEEDVRKTFGAKVFQTIIPRNVRVSEAPSHGKPALFYDFNSTGAQAYLRLATEVVNAAEGAKERRFAS